MKQKDMYTLEELYDNLKISLSKLSRIADINEGTLIRIRKGQYSVRRTTINKLLDAFSEVYGLELSLDNVSGICIEDKRAPENVEKTEKRAVLPAIRQAKVTAEKAKKRVYDRKEKDTGLPDGCILASKFAEAHGVARPTFIDHMNNGLGPGLIGTSTDTTPQRDHVDYSKREKRTRKDGTIEYERYLTSDQQHEVLKFWKRHHVNFAECNDFGCWCHTIKNGE